MLCVCRYGLSWNVMSVYVVCVCRYGLSWNPNVNGNLLSASDDHVRFIASMSLASLALTVLDSPEFCTLNKTHETKRHGLTWSNLEKNRLVKQAGSGSVVVAVAVVMLLAAVVVVMVVSK